MFKVSRNPNGTRPTLPSGLVQSRNSVAASSNHNLPVPGAVSRNANTCQKFTDQTMSKTILDAMTSKQGNIRKMLVKGNTKRHY